MTQCQSSHPKANASAAARASASVLSQVAQPYRPSLAVALLTYQKLDFACLTEIITPLRRQRMMRARVRRGCCYPAPARFTAESFDADAATRAAKASKRFLRMTVRLVQRLLDPLGSADQILDIDVIERGGKRRFGLVQGRHDDLGQ